MGAPVFILKAFSAALAFHVTGDENPSAAPVLYSVIYTTIKGLMSNAAIGR
jgi:hypothetical protein